MYIDDSVKKSENMPLNDKDCNDFKFNCNYSHSTLSIPKKNNLMLVPFIQIKNETQSNEVCASASTETAFDKK